jgi:hypothetical protein
MAEYPSVSESPASQAASITPSDTNTLGDDTDVLASRGVYVGVSGDLAVVMKDGAAVTFVGLAAGVVHPLQVRQIKSTGTTATDVAIVW